MSDDFDDLITAPATTPRRRGPGRPRKEEVAARLAEEADSDEEFWSTPAMQAAMKSASNGSTLIEERVFHMPVSQNFLARVLTMDPMTVNRRLRRVKPKGYAGGEKQKRPLYDFKEALEHLLTPRMDIDTYLASLNPADMPNSINKTFWEAKRIKLKFEVEAGQAWATEDVLEVFGRLFMGIKSHTQLWLENMRNTGGLTPEQEERLSKMIDLYSEDLHKQLMEEPQKRQTRSRLAAIELEMMGGSEADDDS